MSKKYASKTLERILSSISDPKLKEVLEDEFEIRYSKYKKDLEKHLKILHTAAMNKLQVDFEVELIYENNRKVLARAIYTKQGRQIILDESRLDSPMIFAKLTYEYARLVAWKLYGMSIDAKGGNIAQTALILANRVKILINQPINAMLPKYTEATYQCDCKQLKFISIKLHSSIKKGEAEITCAKCKSPFRFTGELKTFTPDIVIKRKEKDVVAYDNYDRSVLAIGYNKVRDLVAQYRKQFKGKKIVHLI